MLLFALIRRIVISAINIFETLLFIRAILSWLPQIRLYQLREFLFYTTEPLLAPVRRFLDRFDWVRDFPFDLSWIVVFLLLQTLAYAITY